MVLIEGLPYDIPMVYLKTAGATEAVSLPFCEALAILTNVSYDYRASQAKSAELGGTHYVIVGDTEDVKQKEYLVSKAQLITRLEMDIYDNTVKIVDMAIQPEDERLIDAVKTLIKK